MGVKVVSPEEPYHFKPGTEHKHDKKRIIVCCDGTWMDSDGTIQTPSNVTRIMRAIPSVGHDHSTDPPKPIVQISYYHNGIGTGSDSLFTKFVGGATGEGMALNIREVYSFICLNYCPGDEIFLLGFSRGAFTARSVSSLIRAVGLLTPHGLRYNIQIFEDWEYQLKPGWKSQYSEPWPDRPPLTSPEYQRKLLELELTRPNIPIKCVAVWDTVGSLGIPMIGLLPQPPSADFSFVDTKVEKNIEYAFHALALDEHRRSFEPTVWEKPTGQEWPRVLKQTWFPGVHSDVGGSYPDDDLADVTLAWMVGQLDHYRLISFNHDYILRQARMSVDRQKHDNEKARPWGLGKIHNSMTLIFRLGGFINRTPKEYCQIDRSTHTNTGRRLENTHEAVHASVRIRMGKHGLGYNDVGTYDCKSLKDWTMYGVETSPDTPVAQSLPGESGKMKGVKWRKTIKHNAGKKNEGIEVLEMPEDNFTHFERLILRLWPDLEREFDAIRPGTHKSKIRRGQTFPTELRTKDDSDESDEEEEDTLASRSGNSSNEGLSMERSSSSRLRLDTTAHEHEFRAPVRTDTI